MCFVFLTDSHGFARIRTDLKRIRTDWNGLERIYKKHEVLDCSFEILEWWLVVLSTPLCYKYS